MSKELDDIILKLGIWDDEKNEKQLDLFDYNGAAGQPALTISSIGTDTITLGDLNYSIDMNNTTLGGALTGASGMTWVTNGTGTSAGAPYTFNPTHNVPILTTGTNGINWGDISPASPGALHVKGDAEFEGDVKIKGKSIADTLEKLEERLAILKPNPELEDRWEELKELSKRYKELEKELIEKEKMWDILKR